MFAQYEIAVSAIMQRCTYVSDTKVPYKSCALVVKGKWGRLTVIFFKTPRAFLNGTLREK